MFYASARRLLRGTHYRRYIILSSSVSSPSYSSASAARSRICQCQWACACPSSHECGLVYCRLQVALCPASLGGLASMSVHTRETAFRQSLLVNDPMVPRGIERPDGEWLGRMWCAATDVRLEWALVESSGGLCFSVFEAQRVAAHICVARDSRRVTRDSRRPITYSHHSPPVFQG